MIKNKKPHRLKFHSPSANDVKQEFNSEIERRVSKRLMDELSKEDALLDRLDWWNANYPKVRAQEKLKLMKEWEKKGRKIEQFINYGSDIQMSIYGKLIS